MAVMYHITNEEENVDYSTDKDRNIANRQCAEEEACEATK